MKKVSFILILLVFATGLAQDRHSEKRHHRKEIKKDRLDLSPEQFAELASKKLTLALDLNETQQKDVQKVSLEQAKERKKRLENRKAKESLSEEERFKARIARLDSKIAHKKEMKSILTTTQYEKWEKINMLKERGKRGHHRNRGHHGEKR